VNHVVFVYASIVCVRLLCDMRRLCS